jgi:hypothetical protein
MEKKQAVKKKERESWTNLVLELTGTVGLSAEID